MANNTEKYKNLFITEAEEKIADLNSALLGLEKKPSDSVFANNAMRAAHTLKSSAAAVNFMEISHLAHAMENFFEQVRSAGQTLAPHSIEMLFQSVDMLAVSLKAIKKGENELSTKTLIEKLQSDTPRQTPNSKKEGEAGSQARAHELAPIETIKVGVATLNKLMNLAEEFLVAKMRFEETLRRTEDEVGKLDMGELKIIAASFGRLTSDLQYYVTQAHMVPLGQLFEQTPRIVRDLAKEQGKEVELSIVGEEIELDRTVVDRLGEPLIHLLRNAVDHGIERQGKITLSAERRRDSVRVSVHNEGRPVDRDRLIEVAFSKGIIDQQTRDKYARGSDKWRGEIENLMYQFSTKKTVTETSGRGVGLGIVKSVIESLGGKVAIESNESGTSFILILPLTLAIVQALLIRAANQVFALPFSQVDRLVSVPFADIKKAFDQEVAVVDEEDIPMIRLNQLVAPEKKSGIFLSDEELQETRHQLKAELMIVTKPESTTSVGLVVDEVFSEQNIVVKPLKGILRKTKGFAGVTLLGDGRPALILDIATLI